jgi:hypothetical protein
MTTVSQTNRSPYIWRSRPPRGNGAIGQLGARGFSALKCQSAELPERRFLVWR